MFHCDFIPVSLASVNSRVSLSPLSRTGSSFSSSLTVHEAADIERAPICAPSMRNALQSSTSLLAVRDKIHKWLLFSVVLTELCMGFFEFSFLFRNCQIAMTGRGKTFCTAFRKNSEFRITTW